ncbi:MAG: COG1361 S-layer family protein [Candidatus Hydrothermarchaeota archaeon]
MRKTYFLIITIILISQIGFSQISGRICCPEPEIEGGIKQETSGPFAITLVTSDPSPIRPGDRDVQLNIWIEYREERTIEDLSVQLAIDKPFSLARKGGSLAYIGMLGQYGEGKCEFYVNVDESAISNVYELELLFSYLKDGERVFSKEKVKIPVEGKAEIVLTNLKTEPETVSPGESALVSMSIENSGTGDARSFWIVLEPEYPFTVDKNEYYLGTLNPGEKNDLKFLLYVDDLAEEKTYPLNLDIRYEDESGGIHEATRRMGISVQEKDSLMVEKTITDPKKIKPGDENVLLKIFIVNAGGKILKNVDAKLLTFEGIKPSWTGAERKFLGNLLPYHSAECDFYLDIDDDMKSGIYPLKLELVYSGGSTTKVIQTKVSAHARFEIGNLTHNKAVQGGSVKIHIPVKNVGDEKAESVKVQLKTPNYFTGYKTSYLGTIGPGESDTAVFDLDIDKEAEPDEYLIDVKIFWDEDEERYTDTETFSLRVYKSWMRMYLFLVLTILVILLISVAIKVKKQRKEE